MKRIRAIGYKQTFDVNDYGLFGKLLKHETGWTIRGVHYFYIDEDENIDAVYSTRYKARDDSVVHGWGDWYLTSDNVSLMMSDNCFQNIKTDIVEIDLKTIPTMSQLWNDMDGEQFKEWFYTTKTN